MKYKFIDYDFSNALKGIAIVFVFMSHISRIFTEYNLQYLNPLGYFGVGIFLFLSGYGLQTSYKKRGLDKYFIKRLVRIIPSLSIVTIMTVILEWFINGVKYDTYTIILNCIGISNSINSVTWYIGYIYVWYILFFIINKYINNEKYKDYIYLIFIILILIISIKVGKDSPINYWGLNIFNFYFGVYIANKIDIIVTFFNNKTTEIVKVIYKTIMIQLIIFLSMFIFYYIVIKNPSLLIIRNPYKSILSIQFTFILIIALFIFKDIYGKKSNKLVKLGELSYEIYLFHAPFLFKFPQFFEMKYKFLVIAVYILFLLSLSRCIINLNKKVLSVNN